MLRFTVIEALVKFRRNRVDVLEPVAALHKIAFASGCYVLVMV
jgi:hypothetical protein